MEIVCGALGHGGGLEDGAFVAFEDRQPGGDVAGVVRALGEADAEISAEEGTAELGHQLLAGIAGIAPAFAAAVAIEAAGMPGPMNELMQERAVVAVGGDEGREGGHADAVGVQGVAGLVAAMDDVGAEPSREPVDRLASAHLGLRLGLWRERGRELCRQPIALLGVEHGVVLEKGDLLLARGTVVAELLAGEDVVVADGRAGLALADMAPLGKRLAEGEPEG